MLWSSVTKMMLSPRQIITFDLSSGGVRGSSSTRLSWTEAGRRYCYLWASITLHSALLFVFQASRETNKMTGTWRNTANLSRHTPQRISHLEFCNFSKYSIREMFKVKVLLWFECCIKMKRLFQSRFRFENGKVKHLNVLIHVCVARN